MFTLNVGTELEQVTTLVSVCATLVLLGFVWKKVTVPGVRRYYLLAILFLPAYLNLKLFLEADGVLTAEGIFDNWFRHVFFYLGQLFFFLFAIKLIVLRLSGDRKKRVERAATALVALFLLLLLPPTAEAHHTINLFELPLTPSNILVFLTDQGLPHILAVLVFSLTVALIRTQLLYLGSEKLRSVILWFSGANACFLLLHIWEYPVENLHVFPTLPEAVVESMEYTFQYAGLVLWYLATTRLARLPATSAS